MQSVTVKLTEVYDLSTQNDTMGLIGIKTPSATYISSKYSGLWKQFKYVRLDRCDVSVACASHLPADPLQIGQEAGKVAPQDMFNPLLYGAVSNESWDYLISRIYQGTSPFSSRAGGVRVALNAFEGVTSTNNWNVYYALLADEKFKKAMVQTGLSMKGLVPLVYNILSTSGIAAGLIGDTQPTMDSMNDNVSSSNIGQPITLTGSTNPNNGNTVFKGRPSRMPRVPTLPLGGSVLGGIPSSYVGVIITPPASINLTYFRLVCSWYVTFEVLRSDGQIDLAGAQTYGNNSYYSRFATPVDPSEMSKTFVKDAGDGVDRSVVGDGIELNLVMES